MLITKIEAKEACDWLRAAGFPQYVQLLRDSRFPVDTEWARRDHHFLDEDALDSLCRRLDTLNKWVEMRLEPRKSKCREDDFEEDFCTISPNWTYNRQTRRWQHLDSTADGLRLSDCPAEHQGGSMCDVSDICSIHSSSSTDSEDHHGHRRANGEAATITVTTASTTDDQETSRSSSRCSSTNKTPSSLDTSFSGPPSPRVSGEGSSTISLEAESCCSDKPPRKKCTSLMRKMEKLRLRGATGLILSGRNPEGNSSSHHVLVQEEHRMEMLQHPSSSSLQGHPNSTTSSPLSSPRAVGSSSSSAASSSSSAASTPSPVTRMRSNLRRTSDSVGFSGAMTRDNQNHTGTESYQINNSHEILVFQIPDGHKPGTFPTTLAHKHPIMSPIIDDPSVNWRTGSFHGYRGRSSCRHGPCSLATGETDPSSASSSCDVGVGSPLALLDHRLSVYDNVPNNQQLSESEGSSNTEPMGEDSEVSRLLASEDVFSALDDVLEKIGSLQQLVDTWSHDLSENNFRKSPSSRDSPAHSSSASSSGHVQLEVQRPGEMEEEAQMCGTRPETRPTEARSRLSQRLSSAASDPGPASVSTFSLLQKLSLLKLTSVMDKFSPCSRRGWSWTVPKLPRKSEATEARGRRVFGVPLLLNVQRTGEPLPSSILGALVHLRSRCLDQVGLFRKSGVKSRIQSLRELVESDPDGVSYEDQSAFDVADMVKQYFRDLPEPIFTSRLCESFLHIYRYVPRDQQLAAVQAAILLLPDENREALRTLMFFLRDVVACVDQNQMTPTNVAVCLAPSLFHLNTVKREATAARSSHRKFSLGRPDQRDLSETLAATQGLANMVTEAQRLFQRPELWPGHGPSVDCEEGGGGGREVKQEELQQITQRLLQEAQEQSRGWENLPAPQHVDLAFKKMGDSCPLWLWRGSVEVDAPQQEVLHRLLREQRLWEGSLRHAAVVQTLSADADVYRYQLHGQSRVLDPGPPRDHLLLRTWQADPSSGPLYLSSVSTEHYKVPAEGIRVRVHSCLYLLEPTGAKRTRLTHLCRTDTRDRSHEWHCQVSGHLLASGLSAIRDSFRPDFKETNI